ncbi:MAG: CoA transferase [Chloroflexi bacterium]|nr:CoA transferase [Chloroflexota bacterium]
MTPPLTGIRVLDHGHVWAGPLLGASFVDMGAEVIKVLAPGRTSGVSMAGARTIGVGTGAPDDPLSYHGYDRGKRSITLNLGSPEGKALYRRLAAASDVIVENFSAGVMSRLGLGYEELSAVNPRIILASLSATGETPGPWRDLVTYGPSLAALYGLKSLLGYHDDPFPREDTADLDPTAAGHAFFAILAALEWRERSGRGQHLAMAQGEATMQRIAEPLMDYFINGRVASTQGNRYPGMAPHGIYRAAGDDRWISIAVRDDDEWTALLTVAGDAAPTLREARFATLAGRLAHQDDLDRAMETWTAGWEPMALTERLQAARVAAFPVMGPPELAGEPNYLALLRSHTELDARVQVGADQIYQSVPWKLTRTPGGIQGPGPATLDADNDYVFGELLRIEEEERGRLRERGVI